MGDIVWSHTADVYGNFFVFNGFKFFFFTTLRVKNPKHKKSSYYKLNKIKRLKIAIGGNLVPPRGFEPLILWLKTRCPGPLDDGGVFTTNYII